MEDTRRYIMEDSRLVRMYRSTRFEENAYNVEELLFCKLRIIAMNLPLSVYPSFSQRLYFTVACFPSFLDASMRVSCVGNGWRQEVG